MDHLQTVNNWPIAKELLLGLAVMVASGVCLTFCDKRQWQFLGGICAFAFFCGVMYATYQFINLLIGVAGRIF
jgi:hypothetical protein